jgi:5-methylcytosine-specific restriction enzyme subunit McrC
VQAQGGLLFCLSDEDRKGRGLFQTKPDLLVRDRSGRIISVIDTKWKRLHPRIDDARQGVSQSDVYQMMAYSRIYSCDELVLLYPHHAGLGNNTYRRSFTMRPSETDHLHFATVDLAAEEQVITDALRRLIMTVSPAP